LENTKQLNSNILVVPLPTAPASKLVCTATNSEFPEYTNKQGSN